MPSPGAHLQKVRVVDGYPRKQFQLVRALGHLRPCQPARLFLAKAERAAAPARQRTWPAAAAGVRTFHDILSASMLISPAEKPRGTSRNVAAIAASTNSTCGASSLLSARCVCRSIAAHRAATKAGLGLVLGRKARTMHRYRQTLLCGLSRASANHAAAVCEEHAQAEDWAANWQHNTSSVAHR